MGLQRSEVSITPGSHAKQWCRQRPPRRLKRIVDFRHSTTFREGPTASCVQRPKNNKSNINVRHYACKSNVKRRNNHSRQLVFGHVHLEQRPRPTHQRRAQFRLLRAAKHQPLHRARIPPPNEVGFGHYHDQIRTDPRSKFGQEDWPQLQGEQSQQLSSPKHTANVRTSGHNKSTQNEGRATVVQARTLPCPAAQWRAVAPFLVPASTGIANSRTSRRNISDIVCSSTGSRGE